MNESDSTTTDAKTANDERERLLDGLAMCYMRAAVDALFAAEAAKDDHDAAARDDQDARDDQEADGGD
jgi:hypothetical protein